MKTEATRNALIRAGLAAFLQDGFAHTRMSDVAERAGLAKGTAYLHFSDKAALFEEVLRGFVIEAAGSRPIGRPKRHESVNQFLRRRFLPILRDLQSEDRFRVLYLVIAEGAQFPELARVYRDVAIGPVLRLARVLAVRANRRGELRSDALTRLPILLAAPVVCGALWNNLFGRDEPFDVATLFESYLDLMFVEPRK